MTRRGESTLVRLLLDQGSLAHLSKHGLNLEVVPTTALREVVTWALSYYDKDGVPPPADTMRERFGDLLGDSGVDLDDEPEDGVTWALEDLYGSFTRSRIMGLSRRMAEEVSGAANEDRVEVAERYSAELAALVASLQPKRSRVDLRAGARDMLRDYDRLVGAEDKLRGMCFGLPEVDAYTRGIWPGEICIIGAPTKFGKSWLADLIALRNWERGVPTGLWTLENSIEMTQLRLACLALRISIEELQDGTLPEHDYKLLVEWVHDELEKSDVPLHVLHPDSELVTPHAIVQQARGLEVEAMVVDQLTFLESGRDRRHQNRAYEIRDILRDLASGLSTGRNPLPCVVPHQISRDGVAQADKTGRLVLQTMSDSSEVEKIATWVFGLYASEHQRAMREMSLQTLASRRAKPRDFELQWDVGVGIIDTINRVDLYGGAR